MVGQGPTLRHCRGANAFNDTSEHTWMILFVR